MIEKIGPVAPSTPSEQRPARSAKGSGRDRVEISEEARAALTQEQILASPDLQQLLRQPLVRPEKVALAKERLQARYYDQHQGEIAGKLLQDLFG